MLGPAGSPQAATDRSRAPFGTPRAGLGGALQAAAVAALLAVLATLGLLAAGLLSLSRSGQSTSGAAARSSGQALWRPRLDVGYGRSGAMLHAGALHLTIGLRAIGFGDRVEQLAGVAPRTRPKRATFARGGLSEWYVKRPAGLEQGFTLARAPKAASGGPLTLQIGLAGNAQAHLAPGGKSIILSGPRGSALRYGDVHASDAGGRSLPSWLELKGGAILLRVDARDARYPLRIDPLIEEEELLTGGREIQAEFFGASAALSHDGSTAVIGAPRTSGRAWVHERFGATWVRNPVKLVGRKESVRELESPCTEEEEAERGGCGFGSSVAISEDGNTALIGSPREEQPCPSKGPGATCLNQGAAYVFTRIGSSWSQQAVLLGGFEEGAFGRFGRAVALSGDGHTALIGAPAASGHKGAAFVFTRSGSTWTQGSMLTASGESGEGHFGYALALSADGSTALVGAPGNAGFLGAAWPFIRSGEGWAQGEQLTGAGELGGGHFGSSVALSAAGAAALIGGFRDAGNKGAAWSFTRSGAVWSFGGKLTGIGENGGGWFGFSVALSGEGGFALVGGPNDHHQSGAAWAFTRAGAAWSPVSQRLTGEEKWGFGHSVALSGDGLTALVGTPFEQDSLGAARAFVHEAEEEPPTKEEEEEVEKKEVPRPPVVTKVRPESGPSIGGTTVAVFGTQLQHVTSVYFGTARAVAITQGEREHKFVILAISPPHAAGRFHVHAFIKNTGSEPTEKDFFTFIAPPPPPPGGGAGGNPTGEAAKIGVLGFGPIGGGPKCTLSLVSRNLTVKRKGRTLLKLRVRGSGTCRGRLTLSVKQKRPHKRPKLKAIATGTFSLPTGRAASLTLALNKLGRARLRSGHGRLDATLAIVRLSPGPVQARSARVRLKLQPVRKVTLKR